MTAETSWSIFPSFKSLKDEIIFQNTKKQKLPCNVLKMAKRYKKKILTGPQAKKITPQVRPSKNARLAVPLRSCRIIFCQVFWPWDFMEFS